jgi:hypothetical protein
MDDTFELIMQLKFQRAREETMQRANGGAISISPQDVQRALRDLSIK